MSDSAPTHLAAFLASLGLVGDPEIQDTPRRVSELLAAFAPPREGPPALSVTQTTTTVPVVVRGMPFHSLCVHHLLPFFGTVAVAYRPSGAVVGLGSIPRTVKYFAHQLQLQERLADQIADALFDATAARSLAVGIRARHMCIEMRGASSPAEVLVVASRGEDDPWIVEKVEDPG